MSIIGSNVLAGASGQAGAAADYQVERSLRFDSSSSTYLSRTPSSAGNRRTWTWSAWVKKGDIISSGRQRLFSVRQGTTSNQTYIQFRDDNKLYVEGPAIAWLVNTDAIFRDPGSWGHLCVAFDTTQSTASNRVRIYWNGVEQTLSGTFPTQNYADSHINNTLLHSIGNEGGAVAEFFNGYLAEIHHVDGQQLTASDFAEYDTNNVWQPKDCKDDLTYGTNGFYLSFADNTNTTTIAEDSSGNNNDFTANNISVSSGAGNDSMIDTPTNYDSSSGNNRGNYATWNPLQKYAAFTLSNGNLDFTDNNTVGGGDQGVHATIAPVSGKFYWEMTLSTLASENYIGISKTDKLTQTLWTGGGVDGYYYYNNGNKIGGGNGNGGQSYGASFGAGTVIGVAVDWDNGKVTFYNNGTSQGDAFTGKDLTGYVPAFYFNTNQSAAGVVNFGQRPFEYTPPTGYVSLCTQNLADPTIADGSTAMDIVTYTGNATTNTAITGLNHSPDLLWIKSRSSTQWHFLADTVRGNTKNLASNDTYQEETRTNRLLSFDSNGFTIGNNNTVNENNSSFVAWSWDAGTSTVSNTDGSITSSVRANQSAGFSIVSWAGTSANATVGHGLNAAPEFIITKVRGSTSNWYCYHTGLTDATKYIWLNSNAAEGTQTAAWNSTAPTSSVIHVGGEAEVNRNGYNTIAYCISPVAGYSAVGSYTGNSSTDGVFIYTGFRVAWLLLRDKSSGTNSWQIQDATREPNNVSNTRLVPDTTAAEGSNAVFNVDMLSNGFKLRTSNDSHNSSSYDYLYVAFASHPLKTARAR